MLGCSLVIAVAGCRPTRKPTDELAPKGKQNADLPIQEAVTQLCITSGHVGAIGLGRFHVDTGGMRGTTYTEGNAAELSFTYRGPSATTAPLASGELRRQIGLKLRAQDTCNVVYIMWHIEPSPGIFVSVKRNAGASTHAECGDRGYLNVPSSPAHPVAPIHIFEAHTLRAELHGDLLLVHADGHLAWEGRLPPSAKELDGPAGIRSDNGAFDFALHAAGGASRPVQCRID